MKTFAIIAFRNVLKNWRHSLAATVSLSAGFISLVLFQGYISDVEQMYHVGFRNRSMYGDLLIENPSIQKKEAQSDPDAYFITEEQQEKIQKFLDNHQAQVLTRVRFLPVSGMVSNGKSSYIFLAMGYDLKEGALARSDLWRWDALYGSPLLADSDPLGVSVGRALGFLLGCVPKDSHTRLVQNGGYEAEVRPFHCNRNQLQLTAMTASGQLNAVDLNVAGIIDGGYKDIDEKWLKTSLENTQTLLNTKKIMFMSVLLNDSKMTPNFRQVINQFFIDEKMPLHADPWFEHPVGELFRQTMSLLNIFKIFIVVVIMTISGLSVFNTMLKIVKERTKEIGTLRSFGYTGEQVGLIFTFEALFLSLVGILIGMAFSLLMTLVMNNSGILYRAGMLSLPVAFKIAVVPGTYLQSFFLLSLLSVVTSWLATRHIVRSEISENLTYA